MATPKSDAVDSGDPTTEAIEAAVFRRLAAHLRHRQDAANIDLMGLAGFCRNCLADWYEDAARVAGRPLDRETARAIVYGEPYAAFKARQPEATPEQLERMAMSVAKNRQAVD